MWLVGKPALWQEIRHAKVDAPLFILGTWRSGTTYLHNLFAQDDRFAYANNYQVSFPRTFLTMEKSALRNLSAVSCQTRRPQDNVTMGVNEPQEDEFAFCSMTGRSVAMGWVFPRCEPTSNTTVILHFAMLQPMEVSEWKAALAGACSEAIVQVRETACSQVSGAYLQD